MLTFTPALVEQLPVLDEIRREAFAPVFASFRALLGDEVYELAQAGEDRKQGELLASLVRDGAPWEVFVVANDGRIVGFVSVRIDRETSLGEIGLNAVAPGASGCGIGTAMYDFALVRMRDAGIKVATVSTGGDASHAPARRAYEKAGFDRVIPSVWMCRLL